MMKKQKTTWIICLLVVALLITGSLSVVSVIHYIHQRELFINNLYYSLVAVEDGLDEFDALDAERTDRLADALVLLDQLCDMQRIYTNGAFSYENRGRFLALSTNLSDGAYSGAEIASLRSIFKDALNQLSDSSGESENKHLTYKRVSTVLVELFREVEEL